MMAFKQKDRKFFAFVMEVKGCLNEKWAPKEHAGLNKSLERKKLILKNKRPSNALHSSREVRTSLM